MQMICNKCGASWDYLGPRDHLDSCPRCENEETEETFTEIHDPVPESLETSTKADNFEVQKRGGWKSYTGIILAFIALGAGAVAHHLDHDTWMLIFATAAGIIAIITIGFWTFRGHEERKEIKNRGFVQVAGKKKVQIIAEPILNHKEQIRNLKKQKGIDRFS